MTTTRKPMIASAPGFRGDLDFLSNFYPCVLIGKDGLAYPTAEHAYQASKTLDPVWRERIRHATTPALAKRLGRQAPLRKDWTPEFAEGVMERVLAVKFDHRELAVRLVAVQGPIVERNTWHDTTWGVCVCERHQSQGANRLGILLERTRRRLQRPAIAPPVGYREVDGDLFNLDPKPDALVNSVNCRGAMGRGVALAFKLRYPAMYQTYRLACQAGRLTPGCVWPWQAPDGTWILNLAVKDDWRQPARMEWIEAGLEVLAGAHDRWGVERLALPHLGRANGWLPWPPIRAAIRDALGQAPGLDVTLVGYQPD